MKKLEKYKIAPQTKFVKFKVKHFVQTPKIRHDKAVPPLVDCLKSSSHPWMCSHPGSWSLAVAPDLPGWWHKNHPPLIPGGGHLWGTIVTNFVANHVRKLLPTSRSSRPEVFCESGVLENFTKLTGKHLCQSLFLIKLQAWGQVA